MSFGQFLSHRMCTCAISSGVVTGLESFLNSLTTTSTAAMTPMRTSCGFAPFDTASKPSRAIDLSVREHGGMTVWKHG